MNLKGFDGQKSCVMPFLFLSQRKSQVGLLGKVMYKQFNEPMSAALGRRR